LSWVDGGFQCFFTLAVRQGFMNEAKIDELADFPSGIRPALRFDFYYLG
jgi:hypothetical protein